MGSEAIERERKKGLNRTDSEFLRLKPLCIGAVANPFDELSHSSFVVGVGCHAC